MANLRGPRARSNAWTWSAFDWARDAWVRLGNQNHCGGDAGTAQWPCDDLRRARWKYVQDNVIHAPGASLADLVDPGTRELRIRLRAAEPGDARLDWESLWVYSSAGPASAPWLPAVGTRWQWQLEARAGEHEATNGIDVDVCEPPFGGGPCVRPDVFDIDIYVDPQIAGRFGYVIDTAAVDAIHASDRHAIGYVTAGDAERWRPDYAQFVDFDRRCDGCLLGNPFSRRFPDEYWANLNDDHGQRDFMLQMMRARTDRVAAAGFDGIEYDIVDTYAQGRDTTGWRVSSRTQLAYDLALAEMAHADGLSVALKNDGGQIAGPALVVRLRDQRAVLPVRRVRRRRLSRRRPGGRSSSPASRSSRPSTGSTPASSATRRTPGTSARSSRPGTTASTRALDALPVISGRSRRPCERRTGARARAGRRAGSARRVAAERRGRTAR